MTRLLAFIVVGIVAFASVLPAQTINEPLYNANFNQPSGTTFFVLKDWSGGPGGGGSSTSRWNAIDTTSWFSLEPLTEISSDTMLVVYVATDATTGYNMAVKIQFANGTAIKEAVVLDSLVKAGTGREAEAYGETTADSIYVGRSVYFDWMNRFAGATKVRLLLAKDTTQASDTDLGTDNSTTAKVRAGVLRKRIDQ